MNNDQQEQSMSDETITFTLEELTNVIKSAIDAALGHGESPRRSAIRAFEQARSTYTYVTLPVTFEFAHAANCPANMESIARGILQKAYDETFGENDVRIPVAPGVFLDTVRHSYSADLKLFDKQSRGPKAKHIEREPSGEQP